MYTERKSPDRQLTGILLLWEVCVQLAYPFPYIDREPGLVTSSGWNIQPVQGTLADRPLSHSITSSFSWVDVYIARLAV